MTAAVDDGVVPRRDAHDGRERFEAGGGSGEGHGDLPGRDRVGDGGRRHPPWVSRRGKGNRPVGRRLHGLDGRGAMDLTNSIDTVARVDRRGRADHGAHRRRHLDRLGHPRLPRARTACGRRTRRRRRRRRSSTTSPTPRSAGWRGRPRRQPGVDAEPNAGHRAIVELERRGRLHAVVTQNIDGLHQRAGHRRRARRRGARHDLVDALLGLPGPPADGRDARPGPRRRGGPAVPGVRRHPQERHDLVRPGARARGHRPGDAGSEECDLLLAVGSTLSVYPVANCVPRAKARRRPGRHRQRRADGDGPRRRRRPPRPDRRHPPAIVLPALIGVRATRSRQLRTTIGRADANPDQGGRLFGMANVPRPAEGRQGRDHRGRHRRARPSASTPARRVLDVREPDEYDAGRAARRRAHPARPPRVAGRGPS